MFRGPFDSSILKRAQDQKLIEINLINIRDFGIGRHKVVDDTPYGGGLGMILRVDVLQKAIENAKGNPPAGGQKVILLDPRGKTFDQKMALEFSKFSHLILVCGHYEGVDERIENFIDQKISIGDFVVTGGEIPAMLVVDSVVRQIKGVLKEGVQTSETFSPYLEYPQYTKPRKFKDFWVPKILLSGNHEEIKKWRKEESLKKTKELRPDLLRKAK